MVRPVPIRSTRDGLARGTGRGGPQSLPGPNILEDPVVQRGGRGKTTARGADGSSACPGDSSHERGAGAQTPNPGTSSKPTNPSACGTQVRSCFRGPGSALASSRVVPNHRPCAVNFQTACGMLAWLASGRGSGLLPKRSARSLSGEGTGRRRLALWPR